MQIQRGHHSRSELVATSRSITAVANTKQVLFTSQKDLAAADGRRSVARFADRILGNQFELCARADDASDAGSGQEIDQSAGGDQCRTVSFADPLPPMSLACRRIEAAGNSIVGNGEQIIVNGNR